MNMPTNRSLLLPYAAPYVAYVAYVAIASAAPQFISVEVSYGLLLVVVPLLLAWAWPWYVPLRGPRSPEGLIGMGVAVGLVGCGACIALLAPFVPPGARPWGFAAFGLRLLAAGLVVPVFEELFTRGFVLRLAYQWDMARRAGDPEPLSVALDERSLADVPAGAWTVPAVAVSTLVFTAGHQLYEWPAAILFGGP